MAITTYDLTNCDIASGIEDIFIAESTTVSDVVAGATSTTSDLVDNFVMIGAAKFKRLGLRGAFAELKKDSAGAKKSNATLRVELLDSLNNSDEGIKFLRGLTDACGLSIVIFFTSGVASYLGSDGVSQTATFMGNKATKYEQDTSTSGASNTEYQSGELMFMRKEELTHRVYRPLTATLRANFVTNFV